ncbi:hypothetical protein TruAng_008809 [Truncatella angustata]|nr:hypothetical protein TruAng_008809 [Truncatella angustata]
MDMKTDRTVGKTSFLDEDQVEAIWSLNGLLPDMVDDCMHAIIASQGTRHPEKIAVDAWDGLLTYRELEQLSNRLAYQLVRFGVRPGAVVPLCFEKSMWTVVAMIGVLKAGGAFALLDINQPEARLREVIEQCQAKVVCASIGSRALCSRAQAPVLVVELVLQQELHEEKATVLPEPNPTWPMYVCFTSGSTGRPKGIVITHSAFCSARKHQADAFHFCAEARVFDFASYSFDVAVYNTMMTLSVGACLCIPSEEQRKGNLNQSLRDMAATMVALTPSTSRLLEPENLPDLHTLILSGEAVSPGDLERLKRGNFRVLNAYGPAECTPMSTLNADAITPEISTNIGRGIGALTWVVDPNDHTKLVPRGTTGELLLEGPVLAQGYLGEPEKTATAFINDPAWLIQGALNRPGRRGRLYKTGDLVCYNADGSLSFVGRKDAQVKIHGQRLELGEVEHHVRQSISFVDQVVAEVIELGGQKERPILAVFLTGQGGLCDPKRVTDDMELVSVHKSIETALSQSLLPYMIPSLYLRISIMPLSVTGKIDRARLREMGSILSAQRLVELRGSANGQSHQLQTDIEIVLRGLWADVLHVKADSISIDDDFILLGGDSIAAMKLVGAARKVGVAISVADVFRSPTLRVQAQIQAGIALPNEETTTPFCLIAGDLGPQRLRKDLAMLCNLKDPSFIEDAYPCTPLQEGMFSLATKRTGDYVLQAVLDICDSVQPELFKTAWEEIYWSAAIFRTRIAQHSQFGLIQVVCRDDVHWSQASELDDYLEKDKAASMGLGDSLLRFALIGNTSKPRWFVLTMHHALYDGWSLQLVTNLVKKSIQDKLVRGAIDKKLGFGVFVQHVVEKDDRDIEAYWQSYLANNEFATFPSLPVALREPMANASLEMRLPSKAQAGVTLSTMIRGALAVLLSHYTGSTDVVFGAIVSGRNAPVTGIEDILGPTIATVPIRVQMRKEQTTSDYLKGLQQGATDMIAYEQIGLQRLAKMSEEGRNACEFQTLLVVQPQEDELESDDVLGKWQTSSTKQEFITYAITLECFISSDSILARVNFDKRVVDEWRMGKMLQQLSVILEQLANAPPDLKVGNIQAFTAEDRSVVQEWNKTDPDVTERCIHDIIGEHAQAEPDAPAIDAWDGKLTRRDLDELSTQLSHQLTAVGVGPEVIVPLCFEKSMFTVVAILGVLKAGGAFVLLDPGLPDSRLRQLCSQVNANVAVTSPSCQSRLSDFISLTLVVSWQLFKSSEYPKAVLDSISLDPSHAAYIIFTSGSTGVPKGVVVEHRSYCSAVISHRDLNMDANMRTLQFGSYNFAGSLVEMLMTLIHGGCLCILSEEERGSELARAIRRLDANWTFLTSTVLANLNPDDVPCLKTICVGGEPIRSSQIEQWASRVHLRQTYGSAELSGVVGSARLSRSSVPADVGKAVSGRIWLVNPDNIDQLAPLGVPGEIILEGPVVGREYIGQPQKTAAAFIGMPTWRASFGPRKPASRFYKTGDLAMYKSDGSVQLLGRKDTQVKLRGQRIEVGEVEHQARLATPEVKEVAVELITIPGTIRGPELVGFLVLRERQRHAEPSNSKFEGYSKSVSTALRCVQARLESVLPHYMVPSLLVPIPELPLTASRKTDRKRLREMGSALSADQLNGLRTLAAGEKRQPRTVAERHLLDRWAKVLDINASSIGIDDSFFRLGGDSIAAMKLTGLARKSGLALAVADIFRHPTLLAQAQLLTSVTYSADEAVLPFSLIGEDQKVHVLRDEVAALCDVDGSFIEDAYPCLPLQEGLLSLSAKNTGDYVLQSVLALSEDVNLETFQAAWGAAVKSIAILRTRIVQHSRLGLLQVICDDKIRWNHAQELTNYLEQDKLEPMELGHQLSRYGLVGDSQTRSRYFVWTVHHALFDGWSLPLILDVVHTAYSANEMVKPIGFNSFVKYVVGLSEADAREYWQLYLADAECAPFPALPPSVEEPAADATLELEFTSDLKTETITSSILLRGALAILIHQYTGASDILFGATVAGRNAPIVGVDEIIGPTIATVPIRVQVEEGQSVMDYLKMVQRDAVEMIAYEQTGLQRITKIGDNGRDACGFQTLLVVHPAEEKSRQDSTLGTWQPTSDNNKGFVTYALTLECFLRSEGFKHLGILVDRLANSEPSRLINDVCAVTEKDVAIILELNKPMADLADSCIHSLITGQAQKRPAASAVQAWDGALTYQELEELSERLACYFMTFGVGPEVIVPLCFEKSMWTVVAMLGVLKAGGAFVLLDPGLPHSRVEKLCRLVKATIGVTSSICKARLSDFMPDTIVVDWKLLRAISACEFPQRSDSGPANAAYVIFTSGSTGEPKGVVIEHRSYCSAALGHGLRMNMGTNTRALQFGSYNFAGAIMEILMTLIYGGCVCVLSEEQRGTQLIHTIRELNANWAFLTSTVLANISPQDVPSLRTICVGGEPIRAAQIKEWASQVHLRQTYGSAETSAVVSSALLDISSVTGDVGKATTGRYWIVDPADPDKLVPIGAPGEVLIEGPTIGREYIGDAVRSSKAFISPPAWRAAFGPHHPASRFYRTGDLAAYKQYGAIELLGRKDTQVKLRGQRIETGEIEYHAKLATPAVKEAAVELAHIQDNRSKGPELVGFLVMGTHQGNADYRSPKDGQFDEWTRTIIQRTQARLEKALPHYMVPSVLVPIPQLPLTVSGKTDRRRLREMGSALTLQELASLRSAMRGERRYPRTEAEHRLQALWSQVLQVEADNISVDDSFFRLGGDSIAAMKLVVSARVVGVTLAVADIFRHPILATQAQIEITTAKELSSEPIGPFSLLGDRMTSNGICNDLAVLCNLDASLIEDAYPCTPLQEGLLSLTGKRKGDYTMQAVLEISKDVELASLQAAWEDVVASTPILRSRIVHHKELALLQVVCKGNIEWRRAENLENYLRTDKLVSMGLGNCLSRFALVDEGPKRPRFLVWTLHHVLYDGWSFPLLLKLASNAYQGKTMAKRTEFRAFVKQTLHVRHARDDAETYWRAYLAQGEFVPFPTLQAIGQEPKSDETLEYSLSLTTKTEVTVSTLIRGAMAILISQYTGSKDVVFGATVSGRNAAVVGIEEIIGPTLATVPVRIRVQDDFTVSEFFDKIQQQATEMIAYEQTGLHRIAKMGESCRDACGFQTLLVVQPEERPQSDDVLGVWKTSPDQEGFNTYAVVLECILSTDEVRLKVGFDSSIISKWQLQNMIRQISSILSQVADAPPDRTLRDINILTAEDETTIWGWNKSVPESIESCVHDLISKQENVYPDLPAVSAWDGELSYRELEELSSRLAYRLADLGVGFKAGGVDTIIPICLEKSKWVVVAILAVLKSGCAFLLIDPTQAADRTDRIVEFGSKVILTSTQKACLVARPGYTLISVDTDIRSSLPNTYGKIQFHVSPSSAAYMMFTSGSTGNPKGILIEHRAAATSCISHGSAAGFNKSTRTLQFSSYAFDACIVEILTTLLFGGCVCIPSSSDLLTDIGKAISNQRVNTAILTPSVVRLLEPVSIQSLKTVVLCGETPTDADLKQLAAVPAVFNGYGPAECAVCCSVGRIDFQEARSYIGRAVGSVSWLVAPEDHNRLVPIGAIGELLIEGATLARGYHHRPGETAAAFIRDPAWLLRGTQSHSGRHARLYKTGDLVRYNENGTLNYHGRKDTQVKIRGQRLELGEVEHHVRDCLGSRGQIVADMVKLKGGNENLILAAFITGHVDGESSKEVTIQRLSQVSEGIELVRVPTVVETALSQRLPLYMIPAVYFRFANFPFSASGKIDRKRLREIGAFLSVKDVADIYTMADGEKRQPQTEDEHLLRAIWAQVLNLDVGDIGIDDNFIRLGGDSITAMITVGEARRLGFEIGVADALHQPDLHHLASKARHLSEKSLKNIPRSHSQGSVEQSYAQGRLWFLEQLYPGSTQYLMPFAIRLRGQLQIDSLNTALQALENRHETLRTIFTSQNGVDLQVVRSFQPMDLRMVDIPMGDEISMLQALQREQNTPFDLKTETGWRVSVYRLRDEEYVLSIVMHHIISDGWSVNVLQKELAKFYSAAIRGQDPLSKVNALPIQYRDYALWQRTQYQMDEHQRQLEYWTIQLENSQPAELLGDRPRPPVLSGKAEIQEMMVQGSLYSELQRFCKQRGLTPFVVLLAAFRATHYRLTGSKDATIGTANANRDRWQLTDMIGFFVNLQCIRIKIEEESFEQLVRQVQATTKASLENQDVPFEKIVSSLRNTRDISRQPLVQIVFTLHSQSDLGQFTLEGIETEHMDPPPSARFDLEFHFTQEDDRLRGEVAFSTDLYHSKTISSMMSLFRTVLEQGLKEPETALETLSLMTHDDYSMLKDFGLLHIHQTDYPRESSVVDIFRQQAAAFPDRVAVKDAKTQLTYAQLDQKSDELCWWLSAQSFANEKLVGVYAGRSCQTIIGFLGILKANLAYVPLDVRSPAGRVETTLSSIEGLKLVLLGPNIQPPPTQLDNVEFVSIQEVLQQLRIKSKDHNELTSTLPSATSLAYVMFTSGSTGKPKGVLIEHRSITRLTKQNDIVKHFPTAGIMAHMGNIAFDITTWEIFTTLLNGGTLVCIDNTTVLNNNDLADIFTKEKVQGAIFTPALFKQCLLETPAIVAQLDLLLVGGDRVDAQDLFAARAIMKGQIINAYGPTENTVISTFYCLPDDEKCVNGVPIGQAISNSGAYVVDSQLRLVPMGVIGELIVTGDGLARGYTSSQQDLGRFVPIMIDGRRVKAYRTGDYVRYRPVDGQMEYFGRIDAQVKVRGYRIELGEIESVLRSHSSVTDAVVVSRQHNEQATQLVAFVSIVEDGKEPDRLMELDNEDELQHVELWENLFDSDKYTTVDEVRLETIGRDFTAWTSMYDGSVIDKAEMNEWLDDTIVSILNGRDPGNVLELGTGTGMVLFNLMGGLQSYVGLEPTAKAIEFVNKTSRSIPALADKVYMQKGTAADIDQLERLNSPNLVVINSVVQYFPSQNYLFKVVEDIVRLEGVKTIFFGDVRSYALYDEFRVTKALRLLGKTASKGEIQRQMDEAERVEQELLVDPAFFTDLPSQFPKIVEHVEILPKKMEANNELSCYRYGAVLHMKDNRHPQQIYKIDGDEWVDFMESNLDVPSLLLLLQQCSPRSSIVAVANIPHKKTILERYVVNALANGTEHVDREWFPSVAEEAQRRHSLSAVDLEELARLAGWRVEISWARQRSQHGGLDAVFHHYQSIFKGSRVLFDFPTDNSDGRSRSLSSRPLRQRLTQKIQSQLQDRLRDQLPSYMIPQKITVLEKIPVTENGKVNRQALAESVPKFVLPRKTKQQPASYMERQLQRIWGQVLYIDPATIGLDDSFFQLGGDSIMAMKAVAEARKVGIELAVADIFKYPTLATQALSRTIMTNGHTDIIQPFALLESNQECEDICKELALLCNTGASSIEDAYPCTPLQEGLISLTAKRYGEYVMKAVLQISEHVDIACYKAAWEEVVASTPILRTKIVQHEKFGLTQVVCRECLKWTENQDLEEHLESDSLEPMELGNDLSHFAIVSKEDASTPRWLVWTIHHALYDGWSLPRIINLVDDVYRGKRTTSKPAGFNTFVKHVLQIRDINAEAYWRSYLTNVEFNQFPALPTSVQEPMVNAVFETRLASNIRSEVTMSTMIRGALAILIAQYVNSVDATFGTVVSGRNASVTDIETILGPTIATIPVRVQVQRKQTVLDYLRTIQKQATEVIEFEQTGLQRIANVDENARRVCGFQTLLVIQPQEDEQPEEARLGTWRSSNIQQGLNSTYAFVLECSLGAGEVRVKASFDSRIISTSQVENLTQQLGLVLEQFADIKPDQLVEDINTLTTTDEAKIWEWNKTVPEAVESCLHDLISKQAELRPDALAVNAWDGDLTYQELESFSTKLAWYLVDLGVGPGTIVPLCFEKSLWIVVAILAVSKTGGAFLLIDPVQAVDRRNRMIEETSARIVLSSARNQELMDRADCRNICVSSDMVSALPQPTDKTVHDIRGSSQSRVSPESAAYVMFTSGSTGQPKGVLVDHRAFSSYTFDACIMEIATTLLFGGCICIPSDTDRLAAMEESIDRMGVNLCFLTPTVARLLRPDRVPSLTTIILGGEKVSNDDFCRWVPSSTAFNGYGPTECTIFSSIGDASTHQKEALCIGRAVASVSWIVSPEDHNRLVPVGAVGELLVEGVTLAQGYINRPLETATAFIENPTWLLRGAHDQCNRSGRLYKTGDLVRYSENGTLIFLGRKDTQVKIRGQRVELSEVEYQVQECTSFLGPVVAEVTELEAEQNRPVLSVFLQTEDGIESERGISSSIRLASNTNEDIELVGLSPEVQAALSQRLPAYMIPMLYFRLSKLPLTASGKVDRRKLREVASALSPQKLAELQAVAKRDKRPPRTQTEQTLQHLWAQILDISVEIIGIDDSFHGLGGDSITAMKLVVAGRKAGIMLAVMDVLKHGTLAALAAYQDQKVPETRSNFSVKPFSLLDHAAKDQIIHSSRPLMVPEEVVDMYPATDFQNDVIKLSMQWPRQSLNYIFIDFGLDLDLDRLRDSCLGIVERFSLLRSVFSHFQGTYFQVTLKQIPLQFSVIDVTEDLASASHSICLADTEIGFQLNRAPTLFMLVRNMSQGSRLVVRLSHTQYDGFCLPVLITSLLDSYQGNVLRPVTDFSEFVWRKHSQRAISSAYWQRLLRGSVMTQISEILVPEANREARQASVPEKIILEDLISIPQLPDGVTLASVVSSAWAVVLSEMTGQKDVVYGSLVSGRDVSMPGVEDIVGPCVNIVPVRAQVSPKKFPHELFLSIQDQNLAAQEHSFRLEDILEHNTNWSAGSEFSSVVQHQNIDENPEFHLSGSSIRLGWFDNPYHLPPRLAIMTYAIEGRVKVRLLANSHIASVAIAETLLSSLCRTIINLITNQHKPLSSCRLDLRLS